MSPNWKLAYAASTLLACSAATHPVAAPGSDLSYPLAPTGPRRLLAYSWNGGPEVPAPPAVSTQGVELPFGELGLGADTRFYLPFHPGAELSSPGRRATVETRETHPAAGLFGGGLEFLGPDSRLELSLHEEPPLGETWRIEFWLFPAERGEQALLSAEGSFRLELTRSGTCRLTLETTPEVRVGSQVEVAYGAWNHVGLTLDGPDLRQIRLTLNGTTRGSLLRDRPVPQAKSLVLGGFRGLVDDFSVRDYPATSGALMQRYTPGPKPGPQRLSLRYEDGTEELELWAAPHREPVLEQEALGRGELHRTVARDGSLVWVPGHWELYSVERPPLPRTTHPTVYVGKNRVFLFGGETRDSHLGGMVNTDDTWIFDTLRGEWTRSRSAEAPPPSCHQSAAYSPDHGVVLYHGGLFNEGEELYVGDETWLYHVDEDRWEKREPQGYGFGGDSDGATVYHPRLKVFVHFAGGRTALIYDPARDAWLKLPRTQARTSSGEPVDYVSGGSPMAAYDPESDRIILYGGAKGEAGRVSWQDRTAAFDVESSTFTVFETEQAPPGRCRGAFAYDSRRGRFVLFGGVKDQHSIRDGDLWMFEPEASAWTRLESSNTPSRRGGYYHMAYDPDIDRFILLCGRLEPQRFENEAWALDLDERAPGTATYVFDRSECGSLGSWFAEWTQPEGCGLALSFQGSVDALTWTAWQDDPTAALAAGQRYLKVRLELSARDLETFPTLRRMGFQADSGPDVSEGARRRRSWPVATFDGR